MIVTKDDKTVCLSCADEEPVYAVPDDQENYPCSCEECGFTDLGPEAGENRYLSAYEYICLLENRIKDIQRDNL